METTYKIYVGKNNVEVVSKFASATSWHFFFSNVSGISFWDPWHLPQQPWQIKVKNSPCENFFGGASPITDFCFYSTFAIKCYFYCVKFCHLGCILDDYRSFAIASYSWLFHAKRIGCPIPALVLINKSLKPWTQQSGWFLRAVRSFILLIILLWV